MPWQVLSVLALAGFAAAAVFHGIATVFFPVLNDFWGNAFAATHWSWTATQQWNGFFPPGYPTILTLLPGPRLVESAFYFNVASGVALLAAAMLFLQRRTTPLAALVGAVLIALHPLVITQILTTGPDAAFVALAVGGALVAFVAAARPGPASSWQMLCAGMLLGAACWIRYHGLNWAAAVFAAAWLIGGRTATRPVAIGAAVFGVWALALAALGLAADDLGALTRDQAFNVYSRLVHPVNWFHLDREPIPATIAEAIARDPVAFRQNYLAFGAPHLWYGAVCLVAAAVARDEARRFAQFVLCLGLVFVPVVNLGASPRGVASFVPLVIMAAVWAGADAVSRLRGQWRTAAASLVSASVLAGAGYAWWPPIARYVEEARFRSMRAAQIETILRADRVKLATQVFAVADFYFVHAPGWDVASYFPRFKGGWPTLDLPQFLEVYPPPSTAGLDPFLDDCQRFGVSHLVLSDASGGMFRELGQVYDGRRASDRLTEVGSLPGTRVFRIVR